MTTNESYHTTHDADAEATGDATDCYVDLDGVTARKSKVLTDDGVLRIEFTVRSTRTEPVRLEIRDALPHGFPLDRVGFHADYGQENWSAGDGHELVYESALEPRGDEQTIYAVKPNEQFDPSLFSIGTKVSAEADSYRSPADAGDAPEMETTEPVSDDEVEPFNLADPTAPSTKDQSTSPESMRAEQSTDDVVDEVASADGSGGTSVTTDTDATEDESHTLSSGTHENRGATTDEGVLARLTTELEEKRASDEELVALEEHLSRLTTDRRDGQTSLEARLQRAERELNELSAYTDALSEFLDERGAGQELLDELEAQAAEVQSQLGDVSDEVSALDERLETVEAREERLDAFDDRFGDVTERLDEITDRLDDHDDRQNENAQRLDALDDRQSENAQRLDALDDRQSENAQRLDALDDQQSENAQQLDALDDQQDENTQQLDALDDQQDENTQRLDALDDRQDATTDRLEKVTGRLDSVDEHVGRLDDELAVLRDHHEEAAERIARTQESVETLDDRLDTAETERAAQNEALSEEIESVAEEVEEIRRWHRDFGHLLDDFAAFGRNSTVDERDETPEDATGVQQLRTVTDGSAPSETDTSTDGDEAEEADVAVVDGGEPTNGSSQ